MVYLSPTLSSVAPRHIPISEMIEATRRPLTVSCHYLKCTRVGGSLMLCLRLVKINKKSS